MHTSRTPARAGTSWDSLSGRVRLPNLFRRALIVAVATGAIVVAAIIAPRPAAGAGRPPDCRFDDVPAPASGYADWASTLVDTIYRLPAGYEPPDLVPVARAGLPGDGEVRSFVIADLRDLVEAAARDGIALRAESAYRSEQTQAGLLAQAAASSATETALALVSRPGHSEHELGTTIDFGSADGPAPWSWLAENGWRYGFVLSYAADKSPATTCYAYEPWHFRYFGRQRAAEIHASGLSTREFLWRLLNGAGTEAPSGYPASGPSRAAGGGATTQALGAQRSAAPTPRASQAHPPHAVAADANGQGAPIDGVALGTAAVAGGLGLLILQRSRRRQSAPVRPRTDQRP